jgi:hypothetical protein
VLLLEMALCGVKEHKDNVAGIENGCPGKEALQVFNMRGVSLLTLILTLRLACNLGYLLFSVPPQEQKSTNLFLSAASNRTFNGIYWFVRRLNKGRMRSNLHND